MDLIYFQKKFVSKSKYFIIPRYVARKSPTIKTLISHSEIEKKAPIFIGYLI